MPWGVLWDVRRPRVDQGSPREAPGGLGAVRGASLGSPKSLLLAGSYVMKNMFYVNANVLQKTKINANSFFFSCETVYEYRQTKISKTNQNKHPSRTATVPPQPYRPWVHIFELFFIQRCFYKCFIKICS